jgi:predicted transcriptional regulator
METEESRPHLGSLERVVMDVLWKESEAAPARLVHAKVVALRPDDRRLAYATVKTVLDRLVGKGLIVRESRAGQRAVFYRPAASREEYVAELMMAALDLSGDREGALIRFARAVGAPDAKALRAALSPAARRKRSGRRG